MKSFGNTVLQGFAFGIGFAIAFVLINYLVGRVGF